MLARFSLREIANHLWQVYGVDISPVTVRNWVMKITEALKKAFEETKLEVSDK
ncbi:MAG: helix-turn-helix domain-containing protein [Candidatus Nezhaarchaeales archaeon]